MRPAGLVVVTSVIAVCSFLVTEGCGIFASGECTDLALCPDQASVEGGSVDVTSGTDGSKGGVDVQLDTLVAPDGPLPDGTCNGGIEDCTNGIDDNCNGLIDCADPVCGGGYLCADNPPMGWSGPVSSWEGVGSAPGCLGAYATTAVDANSNLSAPAATCSCNPCGAASGQSCSFANATIYSDGSCSSAYASDGLPPSFCVNFGTCGSCTSVKAPTFVPSGGACTTTTNKSYPAWSWGTAARTCDYSGKSDKPGGCLAASQCVAKASAPFGGPCIYQSGDLSCPPMGYTTKHLYYKGAGDSRDCTTCTCGAPTGGSCTGNISLYSGSSCGGSLLGTVSLSSSCQSVTGGAWSWEATSFGLNPGSCGISGGGTPTGTVTPTGPTTVCCQ